MTVDYIKNKKGTKLLFQHLGFKLGYARFYVIYLPRT